MPTFFETTPTKAASSPFVPNGIYFGIVKRVDDPTNRVWVEIPRLVLGFDFGPLSVVGETLPAVGDYVACQFAENSTENVIVTGRFLDVGDIAESSFVVTLSSTTPTVIRSMSASVFRSVKYLIQVVRGSNYLLTEILATHNGTQASYTEYGRVVIGSAPATFDVSVSGSDFTLIATSTSALETVYKVRATTISV